MHKSKKLNESLELLKGIACILIVLIHCPFPGIIGDIFICTARFGVPLFFMVSGYFLVDDRNEFPITRLIKKVKNLLFITIFASLTFLSWEILRAFLGRCTFYSLLMEMFGLKQLVAFIVLNKPIVGDHLWFLFALIYCYLVIYIVLQFKKERFLFLTFIPLLIIRLSATEFAPIFGIIVSPYLTRNFLFSGLPFFTIGMLLFKYNNQIATIKSRWLIIIIAIGWLLSIGEMFLSTVDSGYFIGTLLVNLGAFVLALRHPNVYLKLQWLRKIGTNDSLFIYVMHILVLQIIEQALVILGIVNSSLFEWLEPVVVILLTLAMAIVFNYFKKRIFHIEK